MGISLYSPQSSLYATPTLCRGIRPRVEDPYYRTPSPVSYLSCVGDQDTALGLCYGESGSIALELQLHRGSLQVYKEVPKNGSVVVRSHSNNNILEGNAPKIKYFEPGSVENSDFFLMLRSHKNIKCEAQ
jgi:hypothetical protein